MKITVKQIIEYKNLVGHLVLNAIAKHPAVIERINKDNECEIKLLINGKEYGDIQEFVDHWQSQVEDEINKRSECSISNKLSELDELVNSVKEVVREKGWLPNEY